MEIILHHPKHHGTIWVALALYMIQLMPDMDRRVRDPLIQSIDISGQYMMLPRPQFNLLRHFVILMEHLINQRY